MKFRFALCKWVGYACRSISVLLAIPALYLMSLAQDSSPLGETALGDLLRLGVLDTLGGILRIIATAVIGCTPVGLFWWLGGWFLIRSWNPDTDR
jgi:hypothetical protein